MSVGFRSRTYLRTLMLTSLVSSASLIVLTSCDKPPASKATEQTKSFKQMLITNIGEGPHHAWICFDEVGEPTSHTFYDKGKVEGFPEQYLGSEYSIRPNIKPFNYTWRILSQDTLVVESPSLGLQDYWSDVMFAESSDSSRRIMKAISKARGQLYCSLEGNEK